MVTKKDLNNLNKDLQESMNQLRKDVKNDMIQLRKDVKNDIETAIALLVGGLTKTMATKDDLKNFASKDDLTNTENRLRGEIKDSESRLKSGINEVKRQINDINADSVTPQEYQNHEKRIRKLESAILPS